MVISCLIVCPVLYLVCDVFPPLVCPYQRFVWPPGKAFFLTGVFMKIADFLKQPSTIRGLTFLIGLTAYKISPENIADIVYFVANVLALHETVRLEPKKV